MHRPIAVGMLGAVILMAMDPAFVLVVLVVVIVIAVPVFVRVKYTIDVLVHVGVDGVLFFAAVVAHERLFATAGRLTGSPGRDAARRLAPPLPRSPGGGRGNGQSFSSALIMTDAGPRPYCVLNGCTKGTLSSAFSALVGYGTPRPTSL